MILDVLLLLLSIQARGFPGRPDEGVHFVRYGRSEVLRADVSELPRAAPDTWKDFEITSVHDGSTLRTIDEAKGAILRADFVGALDHLLGLLVLKPDFPPALHMASVVYFRLQRYGDSSELMRRYVEVAPRRIGDTRVLGHDLYSLGRYAEARAHYEKVLLAAPRDVEARRGLALSIWRLGDSAVALLLLDAVIAEAPDHDEAWSWKAQVLFDTGDDEAALAAAERARDLDPSEPRTWFVLGRILDDLGRADAARAARGRFTELEALSSEARRREQRLVSQPDRIDEIIDLLDVYIRWGEHQKTKSTLDRLVAWKSGSTRVRRATLDALVALQSADKAGFVAQELERCAGDDARAWGSLASYYTAIGDVAHAARADERRRALENR